MCCCLATNANPFPSSIKNCCRWTIRAFSIVFSVGSFVPASSANSRIYGSFTKWAASISFSFLMALNFFQKTYSRYSFLIACCSNCRPLIRLNSMPAFQHFQFLKVYGNASSSIWYALRTKLGKRYKKPAYYWGYVRQNLCQSPTWASGLTFLGSLSHM